MKGLTLRQTTTLNELIEADARANYYLCAPPEYILKYGVKVKQFGSIHVAMIAKLDQYFFNRINGLGISEPASESRLDEAINWIKENGCQNYMAPVGPAGRPELLPVWLKARGFIPTNNWVKFQRGTEPVQAVPTGLRVEKIGVEQAGVFAELILEVFEMQASLEPLMRSPVGKPGWHHYLAFDGKQAISAGAMYIAGKTAWLGFGGTRASHRQRGGQTALIARRIQDGFTFGCQWFVTETEEDTPETPNPSYHNMLRAGFYPAYVRRNYIHQNLIQP